MKNPDEAMERVLIGLRDAEAPAGMELRILSALEAQAATKDPQTSWRGWMAAYARPVAGGVAIAGACVVGALVLPTHKARPVSRDVRATASFSGPGKAEELVPQRLKRREMRVGHALAKAAPLSKTAGPAIEDEGQVDYDSLAVSEMLAPSKPAPPLSLTQQEKLMMSVLRHGAREEQLAMLDPAVRARDAEQSEAEFHSFFAPPLLNPNE